MFSNNTRIFKHCFVDILLFAFFFTSRKLGIELAHCDVGKFQNQGENRNLNLFSEISRSISNYFLLTPSIYKGFLVNIPTNEHPWDHIADRVAHTIMFMLDAQCSVLHYALGYGRGEGRSKHVEVEVCGRQ